MSDLTALERPIWADGGLVAGFDEVGMGPLAGPVTAACVILDPDKAHLLEGVTDSKKLSEKKRNQFAELIREHALAYGVCALSPAVIDIVNVRAASLQAMWGAWGQALGGNKIDLTDHVELLLIDGPGRSIPEIDVPQQSITKGDSKSLSIAAASILAKVDRDAYMVEIANKHPHYGFEKHKGYGTKAHIAALHEHGPCEIHRESFEPVKSLLAKKVVTL